jgi:hypothetical protein
MGDVVLLNNVTNLDLPPERVLDSAMDAGLKDVVVIGYTSDAHEYFASSSADGGTVLWLLERTKLKLLRQCDPRSDGD